MSTLFVYSQKTISLSTLFVRETLIKKISTNISYYDRSIWWTTCRRFENSLELPLKGMQIPFRVGTMASNYLCHRDTIDGPKDSLTACSVGVGIHDGNAINSEICSFFLEFLFPAIVFLCKLPCGVCRWTRIDWCIPLSKWKQILLHCGFK